MLMTNEVKQEIEGGTSCREIEFWDKVSMDFAPGNKGGQMH